MKALTCEMCNSTDVLKQDGMYVCQSCGTKYTVEEAKKMMIEGTVKIDTTDELNKLYQAARNAREVSDDESAIKHYENINAKDPNSWEAIFYLVILKTNSIKNGEIASSAVSIQNSLATVFRLINTTIENEDVKKSAVKEVAEQCYKTATWLTIASHSFYKSITKGNGTMALTGVFGALSSLSSTGEALSEDQDRCVNIATIMAICGNKIEENFDMTDDYYKNYAVWAWKMLIEFHNNFNEEHTTQKLFNVETITNYSSKISKYDSNYEPPTNDNGGCYVATAVYGSYNCPEVWTLRRYRDDTLASTWYGRAFIRTYYAISPTLVKWFGETRWFKKLWKGKLDKMVEKLNGEGVENTPYNDKQW